MIYYLHFSFGCPHFPFLLSRAPLNPGQASPPFSLFPQHLPGSSCSVCVCHWVPGTLSHSRALLVPGPSSGQRGRPLFRLTRLSSPPTSCCLFPTVLHMVFPFLFLLGLCVFLPLKWASFLAVPAACALCHSTHTMFLSRLPQCHHNSLRSVQYLYFFSNTFVLRPTFTKNVQSELERKGLGGREGRGKW